MRILICSSEMPTAPMTGTRLPLRETLARLDGHEVTLAALRWPEQRTPLELPLAAVHEIAAPARSRAARATSWLRGAEPIQSVGLVAAMEPTVRALLARERFDVVHVTGPALAGIADLLGDVPKVLVALDAWHLNARAQTAEAPRALRRVRREEERRIVRFERRSFAAYDAVVCVSEQDSAELRRVGASRRVHTIANGVDLERFAAGAHGARDEDLLVFVGTMRWAPNVHAARFLASEVLPRVRRRRPAARLAIVGRALSQSLRRELAGHDGVDAIGEVEDVGDWLRRAAVSVSPMLDGTGIKNKVLESLACAAPTVVNALAAQGIDARAGSEILVAEGPGGLAEAVCGLLADPLAAARLGAAGRAFVERNHSWERTTSRLLELYAACAPASSAEAVA